MSHVLTGVPDWNITILLWFFNASLLPGQLFGLPLRLSRTIHVTPPIPSSSHIPDILGTCRLVILLQL